MTGIHTRRVMVERAKGWAGASPALLGRVFNMSVQQATAITAQRCAVCGLAICGHSDAQWSGQFASATVTVDTDSPPGSYERFERQCRGEPGQHASPIAASNVVATPDARTQSLTGPGVPSGVQAA